MSTSSLIFALIAVLFLLTFIVTVLACSFLLAAIGITGLLYRYAEDRYPDAVGITGNTTGIRQPPAKATPDKPLADLANKRDDGEDEEIDDEWLLANQY